MRLVTLTGPGGTGKTRLALAVAAELERELAGGARFVGLAALTDPELVGPTIARALEVAERPGEPLEHVLADALRDRELLVVLDNCERVAAAAPLVAALLEEAPGLLVLATSRTPLRLRGEHELPVPPLPVPRREDAADVVALARNASVSLFAERARAVRRDFRLTAASAPAVAEICRSLDGLPLALELAAARCNVLAPEELLARLERRLDVLTGGPRDLPTRQQTLRAAIDWSHDLLDPPARELFAALAVFSGGCTLAAAEAVCGGDLDAVSALVDQSLLRRDDAAGEEPRFRMLETIREYARERLDGLPGAAGLRRRHAEHFLALAEQAEPHLTGPEAPGWLERLEVEHDNLRAALAWTAEAPERHELELRLATALQYFWRLRGHLSEGRRWLEAALARGGEAPVGVRGRALHAAAVFVDRQGDRAQARRLYEEALALFRSAGDDRLVARTLAELGGISILEEDYERAVALYDETIPLFRESGDLRALTVTLSNLASVAGLQGDYERARELGLEALALARERGDGTRRASRCTTWAATGSRAAPGPTRPRASGRASRSAPSSATRSCSPTACSAAASWRPPAARRRRPRACSARARPGSTSSASRSGPRSGTGTPARSPSFATSWASGSSSGWCRPAGRCRSATPSAKRSRSPARSHGTAGPAPPASETIRPCSASPAPRPRSTTSPGGSGGSCSSPPPASSSSGCSPT